jgi:flagellar biosynthesis/type III secretory pathway protein FliH
LRALRVRHLAARSAAGGVDARTAWLLELREASEREQRRHQELRACLQGLGRAAAALPDLVARRLQEVAELATEIGLAVAGEVVGEALGRGLVDPTPTVRRCLEQAVSGLTGSGLEVRLHPEDLSAVMAELDRDQALRSGVERTHFVPDPSLARAAVRIETDAGRLLYDHREVLRRIGDDVRKELGAPVPRPSSDESA